MMTATLKRILLAEDDPKDVELTLEALGSTTWRMRSRWSATESKRWITCSDGVRMPHARAARPPSSCWTSRCPRWMASRCCGRSGPMTDLRLLPVVILTSSREERDVLESYRLGTNAYVVKPVDFHAFVDAVKELGLFWGIINEPPPVTAETYDG